MTEDPDNPFLDVIKSMSTTSQAENRARIHSLESCLLEQEQVEIPVRHEFCGGLYAREIRIPKGTIMTGRIHKFDHFDVMISGDMTVSSDSGEVVRLKGYNLFKGFAGKKRAGYAHEDTVWVTFHDAPERPPEHMIDYLTTATYEELDEFYAVLAKVLEQQE